MVYSALLVVLQTLFVPISLAHSPLALSDQAAFNAVGRINIAGYNSRSMCTGTLIAPNKVATAAHCLKTANGDWATPSDIHFLAGYRQGEFIAHRRGVEILETPAPPAGVMAGAALIAADFAILRLDADISEDLVPPIPLDRSADISEGDSFSLIAYRRDRPHIVSRQDDCTVLIKTTEIIGLSCQVIEGNSGGPVLSMGEDGPQIIGIVSARGQPGDRIGAYAVLPPVSRDPSD